MPTKVEEAIELAQQISELKRKLKLLEKGMSLKEFIAYMDGPRQDPRAILAHEPELLSHSRRHHV